MAKHLDTPTTVKMFAFVAEKMMAEKDRLTQLDQAIGDGDHGIGMYRGFEAVQEKMTGGEFSSLSDIFKTLGMALMTSIGGASGAIFGTMFLGASMKMGDVTDLDALSFTDFLSNGLAAVKQRGKAEPGDMTMVDALEPAAKAVQESGVQTLGEALSVAAEAAKAGAESTKDMVAVFGRAKTLGERALGHPDPGAISTHLILAYMAEFVAEK